MTPTPPLPDLLAALAQRLPERVRMEQRFSGGTQYISVRDTNWERLLPRGGGWLLACFIDPAAEAGYTLGPHGDYLILECLVQECTERGMPWTVQAIYDHGLEYSASVIGTGDARDAIAPTPAHALACAMVAALSGEGEG